jgi:phospholipase D1/2
MRFFNFFIYRLFFSFLTTKKLKFFEISHLSFIYEIGDKIKEGIIQKRSGGYKANMSCCWTMGCCACWHDRWLIVKDSWVGYLNPNTGEIRTVLLVDHGFIVTAGLIETNDKCGLVIENLSRYEINATSKSHRNKFFCILRTKKYV